MLAAYAWWAPLVLAGAWLATHWLLRESAVWRDRNTEEVREAQRHADYSYRLAVDPPAAKELRLFGLARWTVDRFKSRRRRLSRSAMASDAAAGTAGVVESCCWWSRPTSLVFAAMAMDAAVGQLASRRWSRSRARLSAPA